MGANPSPEEVEEWLDKQYIKDIEEQDDTTDFNFGVILGDWNIHVLRESPGDKLRVRGTVSLPPKFLGNLLELPGIRRNFRTQLSTVLTGTNGFYQCLDDDGEACGFEDLRTIALEKPIYPDQVSQSEVMESLIRTSESLRYISESVDMIEDDIENTL